MTTSWNPPKATCLFTCMSRYFAYRMWIGTWYVMSWHCSAWKKAWFATNTFLTDLVLSFNCSTLWHKLTDVFERLTLLKKKIFTIFKSHILFMFAHTNIKPCTDSKFIKTSFSLNNLFFVGGPQFFVLFQRTPNCGWIPGQMWTSPLPK